jgi:hypothetical protein
MYSSMALAQLAERILQRGYPCTPKHRLDIHSRIYIPTQRKEVWGLPRMRFASAMFQHKAHASNKQGRSSIALPTLWHTCCAIYGGIQYACLLFLACLFLHLPSPLPSQPKSMASDWHEGPQTYTCLHAAGLHAADHTHTHMPSLPLNTTTCSPEAATVDGTLYCNCATTRNTQHYTLVRFTEMQYHSSDHWAPGALQHKTSSTSETQMPWLVNPFSHSTVYTCTTGDRLP